MVYSGTATGYLNPFLVHLINFCTNHGFLKHKLQQYKSFSNNKLEVRLYLEWWRHTGWFSLRLEKKTWTTCFAMRSNIHKTGKTQHVTFRLNIYSSFFLQPLFINVKWVFCIQQRSLKQLARLRGKCVTWLATSRKQQIDWRNGKWFIYCRYCRV